MNARPEGSVPWKTVHVFVSSTFNDMHAERDYLVKRVFPQLQEWCERRRLRFLDVDLRWGVTEDDAVQGRNVIKVCLSRVDECRPFFLCLLGQRRGWIPPVSGLSTETLTMFPGITGAAGASLTELEIIHAVERPFRDGYEPVKHAFFYLRDATALDDIPFEPALLRQMYMESGVSGATEHDSGARKWPEERIPASRRRTYRAIWNLAAVTPELFLPLECPSTTDEGTREWRARWREAGVALEPDALEIPPGSPLETAARDFNRRLTAGRLTDFIVEGGADLANVVRRDLEQAIETQFPDHVECPADDELQRELAEQEEFLFLRSRGFIERPDAYRALDAYISDPGDRRLFVLTGESGIGKSAVLASWIERRRREEAAGQRARLYVRFVGASERSTSVDSLLRSLLRELGDVCPEAFADPIPNNPQSLRQVFPDLLEAVGRCAPAVIVLDALDQLETRSDLAWLPRRMPANVKLIISFRSSDDAGTAEWQRQLDARADHDDAIVVRVDPFEVLEHRHRFVSTRLEEYLKQLDERAVAALISVPGARNPLFLEIVLAELRVFGSMANLPAKVRNAFGDDPVSAFEAVLVRLESDPAYASVASEQAVPVLFGFLAHSRRGLQTDELTDLLIRHCTCSGVDEVERRQAALDAVNLYLRQVRPFLVRRQGRHDFFYESFRWAALRRYAGTEWHALLAEYFRDQPFSNRRKLDEEPWQQLRAGRWSDLRATLCDLDFVVAKCAAGMIRDLVADFESAEREAPDGADLRNEEWTEWKQFVSLEAHHFEQGIARFPALVQQQALNQPKQGRISAVARAWLDRHGELREPIIERINRPTWFHPSVGVRIHTRQVQHLAASGSRAVSAARNGTLECWDIDSGAVIQRMEERGHGITRIELVAGHRVLVAGEDGAISVFSIESGDLLVTQRDGQARAPFVVDGTQVASSVIVDGKPVVVEWDIKTGEVTQTFEGHSAVIDRIWLTADHMVTASEETLRVWQRTSGRVTTTISFRSDARLQVGVITALYAVTIAGDGLQVWELESGICRHLLECDLGRIHDVASVHEGEAVCAQCERGLIVWELSSGRRVSTIPTHGEPIRLLAMSSDGRTGICADGKDKLAVFEFATGKTYRALHAEEPIAPVVVTLDGLVIAASKAHDVVVWHLQSGVCLRTLRGHTAKIEHLVPTGPDRLLSAAQDGTVRVWDLAAARSRRSAESSGARGRAPALLPDGRGAVIVDGAVEVWNLSLGTRELRLEGDRGQIEAYDIAGEGTLVSRSTDDNLRVWNLATGACEHVLVHADRLTHVACIPGHRAVSAGADRALRLWDLTTGACEAVIETFGQLRRLIVLGDDRILTIGSAAKISREALTIWNWRTKQQQVLDEAFVLAIAIGSNDLAIVATWSPVLHVWNLRTGELERILAPSSEDYDSILAVDIDPAGRVIARCGDDRVRAWDLATGTYLGYVEEMSDAAAIAPSVIASDAGLVWHTAGSTVAHYPLHGRPEGVWDLARGRALVIEARSGEIHLLRLRDAVEEAAPSRPRSSTAGYLGIAPTVPASLVHGEETKKRLETAQQRIAATLVAIVAAMLVVGGIAIGLVNAWLWWIGVPIALVGTMLLLGSILSSGERGKPKNAGELVLDAAKLRASGDLAGAATLLERAASACRAVNAADALVSVLIEQASLFDELGRLDAALHVLEEAEPHAKAVENRAHYPLCLAGQYMIHEKRFREQGGDPERMLTLLEKLEAYARAENRIKEAFAYVAERSRILHRADRHDEAISNAVATMITRDDPNATHLLESLGMKLSREEMLTAFRALENDTDLLLSVRNAHLEHQPEKEIEILQQMALTFDEIGDYERALETFSQVERLAEVRGDRTVVAMSLNNQAYMHGKSGRIAEASRLFGRAAELAGTLPDQKVLSFSLRTHAQTLLDNHGDLDAALALAEQAETVEIGRGDDDGVLGAVALQTNIHIRREDLTRELESLERMITRLRQLGRESELVLSLRRKTAAIRSSDIDPALTLPVFDEMIGICRRIDDQYHLAIGMSERGIVVGLALGRRFEALDQVRDARAIFRRLGKTMEVEQVDKVLRSLEQETLNDAAPKPSESGRRALEIAADAADQRAESALDAGRGEDALAFAAQTVIFARNLGDSKRLAQALAAQAIILAHSLGRPDEALPLLDELEALARAHGLDDVLQVVAGIREM